VERDEGDIAKTRLRLLSKGVNVAKGQTEKEIKNKTSHAMSLGRGGKNHKNGND